MTVSQSKQKNKRKAEGENAAGNNKKANTRTDTLRAQLQAPLVEFKLRDLHACVVIHIHGQEERKQQWMRVVQENLGMSLAGGEVHELRATVPLVDGGSRIAGCRASHVRALNLLLTFDVWPALVMEDDAKPCDGVGKLQDLVLSWPQGAVAVSIGHARETSRESPLAVRAAPALVRLTGTGTKAGLGAVIYPCSEGVRKVLDVYRKYEADKVLDADALLFGHAITEFALPVYALRSPVVEDNGHALGAGSNLRRKDSGLPLTGPIKACELR